MDGYFLLYQDVLQQQKRKLTLKQIRINALVIYSPNPEDLIEETIPAFEEKYGIKVDLVQASTGELFKKAEAEKESPCS